VGHEDRAAAVDDGVLGAALEEVQEEVQEDDALEVAALQDGALEAGRGGGERCNPKDRGRAQPWTLDLAQPICTWSAYTIIDNGESR